MQKLFLALSTLLVADVLAQFYFAGVGAFHLPPTTRPSACTRRTPSSSKCSRC
jgi:hypothetical protein